MTEVLERLTVHPLIFRRANTQGLAHNNEIGQLFLSKSFGLTMMQRGRIGKGKVSKQHTQLQAQGQSFCTCSEKCRFPISLSIKTLIKLESNISLHMRRIICKIINTYLLFQTKGLGTKNFLVFFFCFFPWRTFLYFLKPIMSLCLQENVGAVFCFVFFFFLGWAKKRPKGVGMRVGLIWAPGQTWQLPGSFPLPEGKQKLTTG